MSGEAVQHEPVLCGPLMSILSPQPGQIVVDATVGLGGHAQLLAAAIGPTGRLIGLDVDEANLQRARVRLREAGGPHIDLIRANFRDLPACLDDLNLGRVDIILADLGVSTNQLLDPRRGLSFSEDGPLDMRLDDRLERTAADLVNALSESELSDLIYFNSQERFSRRIARRVCEIRREGRITTTAQLARIVCSAVGAKGQGHRERIHPATRTFQALRMAVNQETENLTVLLAAAGERLSVGGRIAVISFHSGEDRLVKQDFLDRKRSGVYEVVTKKPIRATSEEVQRNPRSRSAKLRVARHR